MTSDRFVVMGLAPARSTWFHAVARWSNEAAVPIAFIKTVSASEVHSRLEESRPYSGLIVDALTAGLDRDLIDAARTRGCAVIIVDAGLVDRDWRAIGAAGVLDERFDPNDLVTMLRRVANPIGRPTGPGDNPRGHARTQVVETNVIAVTGSGGVGSSTLAIALAQGLSTRPEFRRLILADMALRADQALLHDIGDVVPALTELVDAHRLGVPSDDDIASSIHSLPERGYHLLLGLRHRRDWLTISGRALDATWTSLQNLYTTIIADVDDDFDGSDTTGSGDLEDRNRLSRVAARRSGLVVAAGLPGAWGTRRLVLTIIELVELGVPAGRILPCVNRAPRSPRARAEISRTIAELIDGRAGSLGPLPSPIFVPERRQLDQLVRDGAPLPGSMVSPIADSTAALLARRSPVLARSGREPVVAVTPGELGTWSDDG